jgi:hypothetical protein
MFDVAEAAVIDIMMLVVLNRGDDLKMSPSLASNSDRMRNAKHPGLATSGVLLLFR